MRRRWQRIAGTLAVSALVCLGLILMPIIIALAFAGSVWAFVAIPCLFIALFAGLSFIARGEAVRTTPPANCPVCDYDLRGHDITAGCPECGWGRGGDEQVSR